MEIFREILANHHQYAREWKKKTGGKVLGYYEPYMPEEVAYAAGVLPVRLLSEHEPDDITDHHMYGQCACTRDLLNLFSKGRFDYVDGHAYAEACQWMRGAFQTCQEYMSKNAYSHYVYTPDYTDGPRSKDLMRSEVESFKGTLEKWTGNKISNRTLDHAINVYNINRRLLHEVYEMRRLDNPVVSGTEAMEMVLTSQVMDKEEHNKLLRKAIRELRQRKNVNNKGIRVMLVGSPASDAELEKLIESLGAVVVIDELCTGSAYFWNEVVPLDDRLMAISLRYLGKPHCALKDNNWRRRPAFIHQLYEDFNAKGVIISKQIYCHPHGTDNPELWKQFREHYMPFHYLERDTTKPGREMKVRLEAFLNILQADTVLTGGYK
jgi:benzoyl-CoA reductase subunit C